MVKWNPYLDEESADFYSTVFNFARENVFPSVEERDEKEIWDPNLWKQLSQAGLAGLPIPEEYGGQSATCFQSCLATESFASGCIDSGFGLSWAAHMIIGAMPIVFQGNEDQKKKYLPKLASGEWIAGLGLTESGAGSDAGSLTTRAEPTDGGYILNGSKMYITNGPVGQVFIIMARTGGKSRGPMGISAFIVESHWKGFQVSKVLKKMGHHTSMTAELVFEDLFVPEENLLGPLNSGFLRIGKATLEWERTVLIAGVVGGMEYTLEACLRYAKEREQFGKSISSFYAIQEKLVKNWIYLNATRSYVYQTSQSKDKGNSLPMESSILKLFTSEVGEDVSREAVQVLGGYGFMKEYHLERLFRDLKLGTIGGGTSEIQRGIVSASFPGYEKFSESLATNNTEVPGWCIGLESKIWNLLLEAIRELSETNERKKNQSREFAFADLLLVVSILDSFRSRISQDTKWYMEEDKIRDSKILLRLLIQKYFSSLVKISGFSNSLKEALNLVLDLEEETEFIQDCFLFLEKRI